MRHPLAFYLIAASTALGIAGTDLVLPAVPILPRAIGGTAESAQFVLAAFTGGAATGLLLFGELGARFDQRRLLVLSLLAYAALSIACGFSPTLGALVVLRFFQGAAGAAAAVFAPGMIRAHYGDDRAIAAIGLLGSIEAMAPALAPIVGSWLVAWAGWRSTFHVIAGLGLLLALILHLLRDRLPRPLPRGGIGGYRPLLRNAAFLRQALSHAFTLGALLIIVFGAPTVFVTVLGGTLADFVLLQILGISTFAVASNLTGRLVAQFGAERLILAGTGLTAAGTFAILAYALAGGADPRVVAGLFVPVNVGLGLRGPPGFHAAIVAADDDARGAALLVVAILLTAAIGTAAVAPFITLGLVAIAGGAALLSTAGVLLLVTIKS